MKNPTHRNWTVEPGGYPCPPEDPWHTQITQAKWNTETTYPQHPAAHLRKNTPPISHEPFTKILHGSKINRVFLAALGPGGFIVPHIDSGPFRVRYHLPLRAAGFYWEEGTFWNRTEGELFRVNHHLRHAVGNPTDKTRIHAIIDMEEIVDAPNRGLIITEMIPEIQELIDRAAVSS